MCVLIHVCVCDMVTIIIDNIDVSMIMVTISQYSHKLLSEIVPITTH